jgi:hypothetical protein
MSKITAHKASNGVLMFIHNDRDCVFIELLSLLKAAGYSKGGAYGALARYADCEILNKEGSPRIEFEPSMVSTLAAADPNFSKARSIRYLPLDLVRPWVDSMGLRRREAVVEFAHEALKDWDQHLKKATGKQEAEQLELTPAAQPQATQEPQPPVAKELQRPLKLNIGGRFVRLIGNRVLLDSLLKALPISQQSQALFAYRIHAGHVFKGEQLIAHEGAPGVEGLPNYLLTASQAARLRDTLLVDYPNACTHLTRFLNLWLNTTSTDRPLFKPRKAMPCAVPQVDSPIGKRLAANNRYEVEFACQLTQRGAGVVPLYALKGAQQGGGSHRFVFAGKRAALAPSMLVYVDKLSGYGTQTSYCDVKARRGQVWIGEAGEWCYSFNYMALASYKEITAHCPINVSLNIKDLTVDKWYSINLNKALKEGIWREGYPGAQGQKLTGGVLFVPARHFVDCPWFEPMRKRDPIHVDELPF